MSCGFVGARPYGNINALYLHRRPRMATDYLPQGMVKHTISLRIGHPDPATLTTPELQAAVQSAARSVAALQYGPERGTPALISYLVEKLNREQKLSLRPEQM